MLQPTHTLPLTPENRYLALRDNIIGIDAERAAVIWQPERGSGVYVTTSIDDPKTTCATLAEALAPWGGGNITPIAHIVALDLDIPAGHVIDDSDRQTINGIIDTLEAVPIVHEITQPASRTRPYELILTVHHGDLDTIEATLSAALTGCEELPWR